MHQSVYIGPGWPADNGVVTPGTEVSVNRLRTFRTSHRAAAFVIAVAGLGLLSTSIAPAQTAASDRPLVLAIDHGRYIEFDRSTGQSLGPVDSGSGSESTGGCAFGNGLFYSLGWDSRSLTAMKSGAPHDVVASVVGPWWLPETIAVAASGDLWVATGDTQNVLYRVDPKTLKVADVLNPALDGRGVWLDLAADQRTMFYTAEGHTVKRYDVVSKKQLPDFAQLPDTTRAYQIALLGPRDGSGGAVVAGKDFVYRLNASGAVVQTYSIEHEPNWIGVLPDPHGTSLWGWW